MKKKMPKQVNICGHYYSVVMVDSNKMLTGKHKADVQIMSSGPMGECEFPTRIIRLNKGVEGVLLYYTLLHEIRHGYQFEMGWPQLMSAQVLEIDCESFVSLTTSLQRQKLI